MAKEYTITVKTRHTWLLLSLLMVMRLLPHSWARAILNYKPFISLFVYVEKGK